MAITKVEGVYQDLVVIYYSGVWYGIPMGSIVQIASAQAKYGLNVQLAKVIDEELFVDVNNGVCADDVVSDMVVELRSRITQINSNFIDGFKVLLGQYPSEWASVLSATIIP